MTQTNLSEPFSIPLTKRCDTCGKKKDLQEDFFETRNALSITGRMSDCKLCHLTKATGSKTRAQQVLYLDDIPVRWAQALNAISTPSCYRCNGSFVDKEGNRLCRCVYFKIFRDLLAAYEHSRCAKNSSYSGITEHHVPGFGKAGVTYSRKNEEFVADTENLIKRVCRELDKRRLDGTNHTFQAHWAVANCTLLDQMEPESLARVLHVSAGETRKAAARIKKAVAIAAVETRPYSLFPVQGYFRELAVDTITPQIRPVLREAVEKDIARRLRTRYA
jgi:hypothetical protein